jgi:hypothetical protein
MCVVVPNNCVVDVIHAYLGKGHCAPRSIPQPAATSSTHSTMPRMLPHASAFISGWSAAAHVWPCITIQGSVPASPETPKPISSRPTLRGLDAVNRPPVESRQGCRALNHDQGRCRFPLDPIEHGRACPSQPSTPLHPVGEKALCLLVDKQGEKRDNLTSIVVGSFPKKLSNGNELAHAHR